MEIGPETERLFHEVVDLSPGARDRYYQEHHILAEVRQELESLLQHDAAPDDNLGQIVGESAARFVEQGDRPENRRCGPYRLVRILGRGGMGTVYLAERADGEVAQRVAIKLLPFGSGDMLRDRFVQERQILAALSHAHIASMLDAGHLDNGQLFLAMEYVEGQPIDAFAARLGLRQKIALFLKVCDAVAYLHRNLVVHRDLKPSNILVTGDGEPKLLDFGISKILHLTSDSTVTSVRMLTPEYASPEQVTGGAVSTATDIYSLGAVLYRLLTGKTVHQLAECSPEAVATIVVTREVPHPGQWAPELKGDLEAILLRALRKDPQERYGTVGEFAGDLEAFLESRPVRARSGNTWYRTRKFVMRYRLPVVLAGLAFISAAAGIVATGMEARAARKQRDHALRELTRAEAINDLNDLMTNETPSAALAGPLEHAERVARRQYATSDANRVELLISIGRFTGVENGDGQPRRVLEDAYKLSRSLKDSPTRARAACALGGMLARSTDLAGAEALVQEGLRDVPTEPEYGADRAYCLLRGAVVSRAKGNATEAITRIQEALRLLKQSPYSSPIMNGRALADLGEAYRVAGQNREACSIYEQAYAQIVALGREDAGGDTGALLYRWSLALAQLGRPLEAQQLSDRAIAIFSSGGDTVRPLFLVHRARLLRDLGRLDEATRQADDADERARQADTAAVVNQALLLRSSVYRMRGNLDHAARIIAELAPRLQHEVAAGNIGSASLRSEQALLARARGDSQTALNLVNEALGIAEASAKAGLQGADLVPSLLVQRSDLERDLQRPDDALSEAQRALKLFEQAAQPGTFSSFIGQAYLAVGRAQEAKGEREAARSSFRSAADHLEKALGQDHPDARTARRLLTKR